MLSARKKNVSHQKNQVITPHRIKKKISKTGQNRPKSAILDKMTNISRTFVCTNNSRERSARMNEMKRLPWSIPKSHKRLMRTNRHKTTSQIHFFAVPVNLSSFREKIPVANSKGARIPIVIFCVWKPQHPGKLEP